MTTRCIPILLLAALVVPGLAVERETADVHTHGETKTIVMDNTDVRPETLTMDHADVLTFVNYSTHPVRITFTEPSDLEKKIRCGFVRTEHDKGEPSAVWALFTWQGSQLVGNVPPGRFASVCSLAPGTYAYTASRVSQKGGAQTTGSLVPTKGRIEVK